MGLRGPGANPLHSRAVVRRPRRSRKWNQQTRVERMIDWIEKLPVTSGMLAGTKFKLRDWQKDILRGIYGTDADGKRIVRQALITMPRKNGKTGLTAMLALAHLCGPEAEARGQIYSAAAEQNQASLIYNEMKAIIEATPELKGRVIVRDFTKHLEDSITGSSFKALSADAGSKHGFSASCVIYDELAQAPNRDLYDVLASSTGARLEPLMIVISTQSGKQEHVMNELVDYGIQVRDGVVEDASFYPCIYSAPEDADPWSEETWKQCNPALDDFRSLEEMRTAARQAKRLPAREAVFRNLYLNQRVSLSERFIPRAEWDACHANLQEEDFHGMRCYGGLDLSGKLDLTALCLVFPTDDGKRAVFDYFWTPQDGIEEAENRDRAPYLLWNKQGHLLTSPGRVIDYYAVALKIGELSRKFKIQEIATDPWKMEYLEKELVNLGIEVHLRPVKQGPQGMDPAIRTLEGDVLNRTLQHRSSPVMNWCMDNVRTSADRKNNREFDKKHSTGRIDGVVALAMADHAASFVPAETEPQFFVLGG